MKRVVPHGYLKDLWDGPLEFECQTVAELINAVSRQTKALRPKLGQGKHQLRVVGFNTSDSLFEPTGETEIHLVPDFSGGKSGGFIKIAIGVVIIAVSIATLQPEGITIGALTISQAAIVGFGATLVLGGLLEVLSPAPKSDLKQIGQEDPGASKYLGAPKNTVKIGTRIPLLYGEHKVYGHYLSFNINAVDVAV